MRVLLAEDDPVLGRAVQVGLGQDGLDVHWARDGIDAYAVLQRHEFGAVVLDLDLPGMHGLDLLHRIRQSDRRLPVIIVTASSEVAQRIRGLDFGADDYLAKPFDLDELLARLRAVSRRSHGAPGRVLRVREVEIDLDEHQARRNGEPVWLSAREYSVLKLLMQSVGEPLSRAQIEAQLGGWGDDMPGSQAEGNLVDVYIYNLRKKLGREFIQTFRGSGYLIPA
jgi:DNA-binding response OmpR family regulator